MDRRVTPPTRVTSPTWGPPPPCKQALRKHDWQTEVSVSAVIGGFPSSALVSFFAFVVCLF